MKTRNIFLAVLTTQIFFSTNFTMDKADPHQDSLAIALKETKESETIITGNDKTLWFSTLPLDVNKIIAAHVRMNHDWYTHVTQILKQEHDKKVVRFPRLRGEQFETPLPEDGVCRLLDMYAQDKLNTTQVALLQQSIEKVNHPKVYDHVLSLLQKDYNELSKEKRWELLQSIHNTALQLGKQKELASAYSRYICNLASYLSYENTQDKAKDRTILAALPVYHRLNPQDALKILNLCIEYKTESWYLPFNNKSTSSDAMPFLVLLHQLSPEHFENEANKLLDKKLEELVALGLSKPHKLKKLEGTSLALARVIDKAFKRAEQKNQDREKNKRPFEVFLENGASMHEAYQERIAAFLPTLVDAHPICSNNVIPLLASPLPNLRKAAFETLIEFFSSHRDLGYVDICINEFLNANLKNAIPGQTELHAFRTFYNACKKKQSTRSIQYLWLHLAENPNMEIQQFLAKSIYDFFGIEPKDSKANQSYVAVLNQALTEMSVATTSNNACPNIGEFLRIAKETGLIKLINPAFLEEQKGRRLFQEETPIKERCQFLNDLLIAQAQKHKPLDLSTISAQIGQMPDSQFKTYAQTVLATLNSNQTLNAYFQNRRRLLEFHQNNNDFDSKPEIIINCSPGFFNAHLSRPYDEQPKQRVTVDKDLKTTSLHNGHLFGYVRTYQDGGKHKYQLYDCNAVDGYVVWAAPIQFEEPRPYCVTPETVYCGTDKDIILMLNTQDGSVRNTIQHPTLEKIKDVQITTDNTLVALKDKEVCFINVTNGALRICTLPETINHYRFHCILGNTCIFKHQKEEDCDLWLIDTTENSKAIKTGAKNVLELKHITGTSNRLYYVVSTNKVKTLVARDIETTNVVWTLALPQDLKVKPELSQDGSKLFALTRQELIALDTNPSTDESKRILWSVSNRSDPMFENITRILVDDASQTVYGINDHLSHPLRAYNMQTGAESIYDKVETRSMLGIHNGKLYLQV